MKISNSKCEYLCYQMLLLNYWSTNMYECDVAILFGALTHIPLLFDGRFCYLSNSNYQSLPVDIFFSISPLIDSEWICWIYFILDFSIFPRPDWSTNMDPSLNMQRNIGLEGIDLSQFQVRIPDWPDKHWKYSKWFHVFSPLFARVI